MDLLLSKYNNEPKIFLIEVENTKYFDTGKYIELKQTREYKSKFPVMPSIICISDKNNKTDDKIDVIFLKTDLSDMENYKLGVFIFRISTEIPFPFFIFCAHSEYKFIFFRKKRPI